jgi:hypothetical protein
VKFIVKNMRFNLVINILELTKQQEMVESFTLGMTTAFLLRVGVMRSLRWPVFARKYPR